MADQGQVRFGDADDSRIGVDADELTDDSTVEQPDGSQEVGPASYRVKDHEVIALAEVGSGLLKEFTSKPDGECGETGRAAKNPAGSEIFEVARACEAVAHDTSLPRFERAGASQPAVDASLPLLGDNQARSMWQDAGRREEACNGWRDR